MTDPAQEYVATSEARPIKILKYGLLLALAFAVVWLGVSWKYGWLPFTAGSIDQSSETPSPLTASVIEAALEGDTETGPSQLTADVVDAALQ